mmetsp:Transcript_3155/g.19448  ORF Transcript_3155/g.19448 Transcript_3155/m.19448 type:complete len:524 (-) Transcript_3155:993-2564(-)
MRFVDVFTTQRRANLPTAASRIGDMELRELRKWRTIGACACSCFVCGCLAHVLLRNCAAKTALAWLLAVLPVATARARAARAAPPSGRKARRKATVVDAAFVFAGVGCAAVVGAPATMAAMDVRHLFPDTKQVCGYGIVLAVVHTWKCVVRRENVLAFPVVQRHRLYRWKQAFLENVADAMIGSLVGTAVHVWIVCMAERSLLALGPRQCLVLLHLGWFLSFCWETVGAIVDIVFTEHVCFGKQPPDAASQRAHSKALLEQLQEQDEYLSHLALWDLACLAKQKGPGEWRQRLIYDDESGKVWDGVAKACFAPLNMVLMELSTELKKIKKDAPQKKTEARQWNTQYIFSTYLPDKAAAENGVFAVEAAYQKCVWAGEALSQFVVDAKTKDNFGILQLSEYSIGRVVRLMVSALCVIETFIAQYSSAISEPSWIDTFTGPNFVKWVSSRTKQGKAGKRVDFGYKNSIDSACFALYDSIQVSLYKIVDAYGPELELLVAQVVTKTESQSREVVLAKLRKLMEYAE